MYKYKQLLILIILISVTNNIYAVPTKVSLILSNIKALSVSEKTGEEVYFTMTHYSNIYRPKQDRIPIFPTHWLSMHLPTIKDLTLWEYNLQDDEAIQLIVSLIEHDTPPWNLDDHIGSIKITLVNENNQIKTIWGEPDYSDQTTVNKISNGNNPEYILRSDASQYNLNFSLEFN